MTSRAYFLNETEISTTNFYVWVTSQSTLLLSINIRTDTIAD